MARESVAAIVNSEQELVLRWKDAGRETDVRVIGEIVQQGAWHTYEVAFVDEKLEFWRLEFPEPPMWQERPASLQLECGGCREIVELANGDSEYDICAIHGGLRRYCEDCRFLTVWRQPSEAMPLTPRAKRLRPYVRTSHAGATEETSKVRSSGGQAVFGGGGLWAERAWREIVRLDAWTI